MPSKINHENGQTLEDNFLHFSWNGKKYHWNPDCKWCKYCTMADSQWKTDKFKTGSSPQHLGNYRLSWTTIYFQKLNVVSQVLVWMQLRLPGQGHCMVTQSHRNVKPVLSLYLGTRIGHVCPVVHGLGHCSSVEVGCISPKRSFCQAMW